MHLEATRGLIRYGNTHNGRVYKVVSVPRDAEYREASCARSIKGVRP